MSNISYSGMLILLLALAAATGGMLRFAVSIIVARRWGVQFPLATLLVNSSGALMMGLLAAWLVAFPERAGWELVIGVGLLGSYTTVSSFSLQTLILWQNHHYRQALLNIGLSFGLCLTLLMVGFMLGSRLW